MMEKFITDLSNELIDSIFSFIDDVHDLRAISETCKRFNAVVERHLYHTIGFSDFLCDYGWPTLSRLPKLVLTLIRRPKLALLVKRASFINPSRVGNGADLKPDDLKYAASNFQTNRLDGKVRERLTRDLAIGVSSAYWTVLMVMCVNLEVLDTSSWNVFDDNDEWVREVFHIARSPQSSLLSRLRRVNSYGLALRSIRDPNSLPVHNTLVPSVQELVVYRGAPRMDLDLIAENCPCLRSFELHQPLDHSSSTQEAMLCLTTLAPTLESLSLLGRAECNLAYLDFRSFPRLKHLVLTLDGLLWSHLSVSEQQKIVDRLPCTLKRLEFEYDEHEAGDWHTAPEEYCGLLDALKQRISSHHYPYLKFLRLAFTPHSVRLEEALNEEPEHGYKTRGYEGLLSRYPLESLDVVVKAIKAEELRDVIRSKGVKFQLDILDEDSGDIIVQMVGEQRLLSKETKAEKGRRLAPWLLYERANCG